MELAVITYIFGKDKELLREPLVVDKDVEYICVTDQKDLKSKIWKIIYDDIPEANCTRDKMVYVKYRPFKYTNANKVCVIDGSIEIKSSLLNLFKQLENNDILIKKHPGRDNLNDELIAWNRLRGMTLLDIAKFKYIADKNNIDLNKKFLIESCVLLFNKNNKIKNLCEDVISYMKFIGGKTLFLSNQCTLTMLLQFDQYKIKHLNQNIYFNKYHHNSYFK